METGSRVSAVIDELIALFHKRSDDLPDGVFDRRTQFLLNGNPFEALLGRSSSDPIVLMLTRGAAGYRFTSKAVLHAVPDAHLDRGEITEAEQAGERTASCQCWLSGHLRATGEPMDTVFSVELRFAPSGVLDRVAVTVPEGDLARLREARLRS